MNVKDALLAALANANGALISGSRLANELNVSRNAVWKAVKALEADGFAIESTPKGYRIAPGSNILSAPMISAANSSAELGSDIVILENTTSTNNYAKELAANGAAHGTVVIADTQSAGKGRLGRTFASPPGKGLYMSVIIRPKFSLEFAPLITTVAAVASAEAVEELSGSSVQIKWVNDLYMNGRKICGILTEASLGLEINTLDYAVIGIGINVGSCDLGDELGSIATSVEAETGHAPDRNKLCGRILTKLEHYLSGIENRIHMPEYSRRELLTGHEITANVGNEAISGTAIGVDENAGLIVKLTDGTERVLSSGEANLCRIKK